MEIYDMRAKQHTFFLLPLSQMWCDHIWKHAVSSAHAMCKVQQKDCACDAECVYKNIPDNLEESKTHLNNYKQPEDVRTSQRNCATFNSLCSVLLLSVFLSF